MEYRGTYLRFEVAPVVLRPVSVLTLLWEFLVKTRGGKNGLIISVDFKYICGRNQMRKT